jgi:hypothetical protein
MNARRVMGTGTPPAVLSIVQTRGWMGSCAACGVISFVSPMPASIAGIAAEVPVSQKSAGPLLARLEK